MEGVAFTQEAIDDLNYWKKSGNTIILKRIHQLLQAIKADPFNGIDKPEPLKHDLSGSWSRRINQEHRVVYSVKDKVITVYSLRFHYKN